jgi:pyridoxamine 5'-phosphate oxidase
MDKSGRMTGPIEPDVFDLAAVQDSCWALLARGVADRRHAFHHPAIATIDADGAPRSRIVILRGVDAASASLRFHTDRRSAKCAEIAARPRISCLFYDPEGRIQLRVDGMASLHLDDAIADAAWASSQRMSRVCYGTAPAPGTPLASPDAFALPEDDAAIAAGRAHFAAVVVTAERLEWLFLRHEGHRRAAFDLGSGAAEWLAP